MTASPGGICPNEDCDVLVVGGGPAGAASAGLLAAAGRRVVLLEKEKFPRYHVGESLISAVWPTIDLLGLRPRIESLGAPRKYGGRVRWGRNGQYWAFAFADAGSEAYAYQVERAQFDALLLHRARELGTHVVEEATVTTPLVDEGRVVGAVYERHHEAPRAVRARILVDASGQRRWLGSHFNLVKWHTDLRNVAVWSYFEGCHRYPGLEAGDTLIEYLAPGWLWFIPLNPSLTSIGYVAPSRPTGTDQTIGTLLEERIGDSVEVKRMMAGARRASGYRSQRDWSYHCSRLHGPGWVLAGDAGAFVDPLLSTGVALALRSARTLVAPVLSALDDPERESEYLGGYEKSSRRFLNVILDFVRFFYQQDKERDDYFEGAQAIIDPGRSFPPQFDFVKLVSGLAEDSPEVAPAVSGSVANS